MIIRNEKPSDIEAITEVTIAAFKNCKYGNHTEQFIIHALRAAVALTVSLVAGAESIVLGHIAFSPVTISPQPSRWYGPGQNQLKAPYVNKKTPEFTLLDFTKTYLFQLKSLIGPKAASW